MSNPVLYDTVNSFYCQVVRMTLAENGVPFTSQLIDMSKGEHLKPWFAKKNPVMMLPTLDLEPDKEKGQVLLDSREICKHFDK